MKQNLKYILFVIGVLALIGGVAIGKNQKDSVSPISGAGIIVGIGFLLIFVSVVSFIAG